MLRSFISFPRCAVAHNRQSVPKKWFCASSRALSTAASSEEHNDKIYELRKYVVQPSRYAEYLKIAEEKFHLRTAHSRLIGCWTAELGGQNEVFYMWEYDNFAQRTAQRKAMMQDKSFVEGYMAKLLPTLVSQENVILRPFDLYQPQLNPGKSYGSYEFVVHTVKPGMMPQFEHRIQRGLPARLALDYPQPVGIWYSDFGPLSSIYSIWPHESLDERAKHRRTTLFGDEEWRETYRDTMLFIQEMYNKALVPLPFSPLQ